MYILFSDNTGVFDRKREPEHNEVGICAVEAMRVIGVKLRLVGPHKFHDLVLPLTWSVRTRENNTEVLPIIVLLDLLLYEKMQHFVELVHEGGSRRNGVVFEVLLAVCDVSIAIEFGDEILVLLRTPEASSALVVHLAPGGHSVQSHDNHLGGLEHIDERIDVVEYFDPNLLQLLGHELRLENDRVVLPQPKRTRTHL